MAGRGDQGGDSWGGGDGGLPPEIEKIFKNVTSGFKGGRFNILIIIAAVVLAWIVFSSAYTVGVDEVGVIQRFGKYVRTTMPGLHFKFPRGLETLTKVKVKYVYTEEFGLRTLRAGIKTEYASGKRYLSESLMLTGDLNTAIVPWIVQFRIDDPYKFLFKVRNVRLTLRDLSESSMRLVVGDRSVNEVISKRKEIADEVRIKLQITLNDAETGIKIVNVELKKTNVPEPVQASFNEVNQAVQEKEKLIYQAKEEYNKIIPKAKGEAEQTIKAAEGYAMDRVNRAKGDASRFLSLFKEYAKAKDVTRRRLYLESMSVVLPKLGNKYIIDPEQKGILPLLNLGKGGEEK
ncbi:MAG: FtsH protease activity modulator HflK [Deltaproteobacteria bacterium]|nr:FtsH protease activity modulator HflK [Deltaproteobacteria bacterium]